MAASPKQIADVIVEKIRRNDLNAITYSWKEFYEVCDKERIREAFVEKLEAALEEHGFLLAQGNNIVLVVKDFRWGPVEE